MKHRIFTSPLFYRAADGLVPLLAWIIITVPLWLSFFHPAVVAYFIISFDMYFFYKSISTAINATQSYLLILNHMKIPYFEKVLKLPESAHVHHFVIIPNYKEPLYKLESTIDSLVKNDYPHKTIYLVLAFEKREEDEAYEKERIIREKYSSFFKDIIATYHILNDAEAPGKASNQTWAARIVETYAVERNFPLNQSLITICDADSHMPTNYFSYLTYTYLTDPDNAYHFYWAPVLLYSNFWQIPFIIRIQATLSSVMRLAFLAKKENLIQISTYSTNLQFLKSINYWDVDIIPEDWHIYLQAFFTYGNKVRTIPLYTIINGDAVYSGGLIKTLQNRYEQEKRWAWGVSDIGYAIKKFFTTPHLGGVMKLKKIIFIAENHLLWPTSFFVLTISASIPPLINPVFKRTVLGFLLPQLSGLILTFASSMLLVYVYLDIKLRQKVKVKTDIKNVPFLFIQWYLLPIISFFFSALPALESHTKLLMGKKMKYKVTEKV